MTSRTMPPEAVICTDPDVAYWVKLLVIVLKAHPNPEVITHEYLQEAATLPQLGELIPANYYYGLDIDEGDYPLTIRWRVDTFTDAQVAVLMGATTDVMPKVVLKGDVRLTHVGSLIKGLKDRVRPYA